MNLDEKVERAMQAIKSIATHDDQHVLGRVAVLEGLKADVDSQIAAALERAESKPAPAEGG